MSRILHVTAAWLLEYQRLCCGQRPIAHGPEGCVGLGGLPPTIQQLAKSRCSRRFTPGSRRCSRQRRTLAPAGLPKAPGRIYQDSNVMLDRSESSHPERAQSPLRELRLRKGWSAEDLASRAGVSGRAIYDIEGGYRQPRRATRHVLAQALGCDPAELTPATQDESPAAEARLSSKPAGTGRNAPSA